MQKARLHFASSFDRTHWDMGVALDFMEDSNRITDKINAFFLGLIYDKLRQKYIIEIEYSSGSGYEEFIHPFYIDNNYLHQLRYYLYIVILSTLKLQETIDPNNQYDGILGLFKTLGDAITFQVGDGKIGKMNNFAESWKFIFELMGYFSITMQSLFLYWAFVYRDQDDDGKLGPTEVFFIDNEGFKYNQREKDLHWETRLRISILKLFTGEQVYQSNGYSRLMGAFDIGFAFFGKILFHIAQGIDIIANGLINIIKSFFNFLIGKDPVWVTLVNTERDRISHFDDINREGGIDIIEMFPSILSKIQFQISLAELFLGSTGLILD